ncbi:hypothetical protein OS493_000535 [Desmophyllum pertusum]|uniref:Uncharacterized protein n=1 Tax=Desmophyllum pertusum TaxID=174260 RepID=A0A9X0DE67_9CNID|nr:hypothetical protein OS493_000535 [Desmophyllum pertusum]
MRGGGKKISRRRKDLPKDIWTIYFLAVASIYQYPPPGSLTTLINIFYKYDQKLVRGGHLRNPLMTDPLHLMQFSVGTRSPVSRFFNTENIHTHPMEGHWKF